MKTHNRVILSVAAVVLASLCAIGSALAYSTWRTQKTNSFKIGTNKIEIHENGTPKHGDNTLHSSGGVTNKDVQVTNTGNVPCYVRVFMEISNDDAAQVSKLSSDGTTFYPVNDFRAHLANSGNWRYASTTGWYYYTQALQPGETTDSLLKAVETDYTNAAEDISSFDIIVHAESVQTKTHTGEEASNYADAWNQFTGRK